MPTNYGLYQLANSRAIPQYVGSVVPELGAVAGQLQGRYDTARDREDALDQALRNAASLGADAKMLEDLKNQYRTKISSRAEKGDYENMLRDISKDAGDFVQQYRPIAANQAAVSAYYNDLQERVTKGEVSKDWADKLYDYSTRGYKGLKKNALTGQYENQFRGETAVKNIDLQDWTDKALKGLDPRKIGWNVRRDENGFYHETGGTREYLTMKEIAPALNAAMAADPMFQSYAGQKAMLDSYSAKYTNDIKDAGASHYRAVQDLAKKQGIPYEQALEQYMANSSRNQLYNTVMAIGSKYQKDNRTSIDRDEGETAATKRRLDAEAADTISPFSANLMMPDAKLAYNDPGKLAEAIHATGTDLDTVVKRNQAWMQNAGVRRHRVSP